MFASVTRLLAVAALASVAQAHFTLNYPYTRGFDEDTEPNTPCGGASLNKTRTPFPLQGGFLTITSAHPTAKAIAFLSLSSNPTSLSDFNNTQNAAPIVPAWKMTAQGDYCLQVAIPSSLSDAKNGTQGTVLVNFDGGDGNLFQCSDVVLLSDYKVPSDIKCTNAATVSGGNTASSSSSSAASSTAASSASTTASSAAASPSSSSIAFVVQPLHGLGAALGLVGAAVALL